MTADAGPSWFSDPFGCCDLKLFKREWKRLLLAWSFLQTCSYFDCLAMARLQLGSDSHYYLSGTIWAAVDESELNGRLPTWEAERVQKSVVLRDVGHRHLPHIDPTWSDCMAIGATVLVWVRFLTLPGPRSMRWQMVRRLWFIMGFVRFFRSITIQATVLPNPDLECVPKLRSPDNMWIEALWILANLDVTCKDVLYSEHSCTIVLMALFWAYYATSAPLRPLAEASKHRLDTIVKTIVLMYAVTGFLVIVSSRFHYSDDVLLAVLVCGLCFISYHLGLRSAPFHTGFPFDQIMWLEGDSPDVQKFKSRADVISSAFVEM